MCIRDSLRTDGKTECGQHRRPAACYFDRSEIDEPEPAFHRRNRDGDLRLLPSSVDVYKRQLPDYLVLIFVEEEVDKRNRMYKAVQKQGRAVEFARQDEKTLMTWVLAVSYTHLDVYKRQLRMQPQGYRIQTVR